MKKGKMVRSFTFCPLSFCPRFACRKARTKTMGMMAKVRVSFTVTALSKVALPNPHILSHVEAAAVTEEVSFTAVPAKMPNPSPDVVLKPRKLPKIGKMIAARTLKKKITEIDWATSSSSALITGAVAAMAEPPQMEEPTPMRVALFAGMGSTL